MLRRRLRCSFCGRDESAVEKLVAGPRVYICDRCVAAASTIMAGEGGARHEPEARRGGWRALLQRVGRALRPPGLRRARIAPSASLG